MSDTAGSRNYGSRDGAGVDQLLLEAGMNDDGVLRPMLLDLQALAGERPAPSDAVAALMIPAMGQTADQLATARHLTAVPGTAVFPETVAAPGMGARAAATDGLTAGTDELAARRRAKRRVTFTALSVAVSLAAGGAVAVASDQGLRDSIGHVNQAVTSFVATVGGGPAHAPVQTPAQTPVPVPAAPATVPTAPPVTHAPTAPSGSDARQNPQHTPAPSDPAAVPLPDLRSPVTADVPAVPEVTGVPLNGQGLPLPATPPVPLPVPGR